MLSRWLARITGVSLLSLAVCGAASAQYGGGGSMGSGGTASGTMGANGPSYGNGKAIGIGVGAAAAAAVGIALYVHHRHAPARSEASVIGCTQSVLKGISLKNESDDQTYTILSNGTPLQAGERVELKGVVKDEGSGTQVFRVRSLVNNFGTCGSAAAAMAKPAGQEGEIAQVSK